MMLLLLWEECARCGHVGECENLFPPSGECPAPEAVRTGMERPCVIQPQWNHQHLFRSVETGKGPASPHPSQGAGLSSTIPSAWVARDGCGDAKQDLHARRPIRFGMPVTTWLPASTASMNRQCATAVASRARLGYRA